MSEVVAFSKDQQAAILGRALVEPETWDYLDRLEVTKEWLVDQTLAPIFDHGNAFRKYYGKAPNAVELVEFVRTKESFDAAANFKKRVDRCVEASRSQPFDTLAIKLTSWAKSRVVFTHAKELAARYTEGKHAEAFKIWDDGALKLQRLDAANHGGGDHFESSGDRVEQELQDRISGRILDIGVPFAQDAFDGIIHHDMMLIGGRPGGGKTEMAKMIARAAARRGEDTYFFALEAEKFEIERRIKFPMLCAAYRQDRPGERIKLRYRAWRLGKLEHLFKDYNATIDAQFKEEYSHLHTFYRDRGEFGLRELDREVLKIHKKAKLIVVDHLHYIDLGEGADENRDMTKLVMRLRHFALDLGVPVVVVAHLRKKGGGETKSLVPDQEAYHGSSNIIKVATKAIMLAPAGNIATADPDVGDASPTFLRVVKDRLGSEAMGHVAVAFYDRETACYRDKYALGRLNLAETKWTPIKDEAPDWALGAKVTDISESD